MPHKEAIANQTETLAAIESRNANLAVRAMDAHLSSLEVVLIGSRLPMPLVAIGGGISSGLPDSAALGSSFQHQCDRACRSVVMQVSEHAEMPHGYGKVSVRNFACLLDFARIGL